MSEKQIYFAAANTGSGFVSYFSEIFDPDEMKKLYIIKGGPGTGKSTLAGKLADAAEERGHTVTRYLCSSDPSSLDGIMIEDLRVGVIDGTAPHAAAATAPISMTRSPRKSSTSWSEGGCPGSSPGARRRSPRPDAR